MSGQAIAKSFAIFNLNQQQLKIEPPVWLDREVSLFSEIKKYESPVVCIATPHALHCQSIIEANQAKCDAILCEKPACVDFTQLRKLQNTQVPTAILHGYRQMWGIQTLKRLAKENYFGEITLIEGRYWQASVAEEALNRKMERSQSNWKDDPSLSGKYDTYLDLGTHWVDAVSFIFGNLPSKITAWRSYVNSNSPHRDTHVQLSIDFPNGRASGSVSKNYHGATHEFEIYMIGSKKSALWKFLKPDEILIGEGQNRHILTRKNWNLNSTQPPFHGLGWLEGYVEIISQLCAEVYQNQGVEYPRLKSNLLLLEAMLNAEWIC